MTSHPNPEARKMPDLHEMAERLAESHARCTKAGMAAVEERHAAPLLMLEAVYRKAQQDPNFVAPTPLHIAIESCISLLPDRTVGA